MTEGAGEIRRLLQTKIKIFNKYKSLETEQRRRSCTIVIFGSVLILLFPAFNNQHVKKINPAVDCQLGTLFTWQDSQSLIIFGLFFRPEVLCQGGWVDRYCYEVQCPPHPTPLPLEV